MSNNQDDLPASPRAAAEEVNASIAALRTALERLEAALGAVTDGVVEEAGAGPAMLPPAPAEAPASGLSGWTAVNDYSWPGQTRTAAAEPSPEPQREPGAAGAGWRPADPVEQLSQTHPQEEAPRSGEEVRMEPGPWPHQPTVEAKSLPADRGAAADSPAGESAPPIEDDAREQVRRAVEALRKELDASDTAAAAEPLDPATPVDAAPSVQPPSLFEMARDSAGGAEAPAPAGQKPDLRDQVRRAVEEARAEIESSAEPQAASGAGAFDAGNLRIPHYEKLLDERFLQPAVLVIDDPEGRVELVRVYRTLARLDVAATANLANYSSHSVTVQLEEREVPAEQDIIDAISYAFERDCSVDIDGNRASIRLYTGKSRVA